MKENKRLIPFGGKKMKAACLDEVAEGLGVASGLGEHVLRGGQSCEMVRFCGCKLYCGGCAASDYEVVTLMPA